MYKDIINYIKDKNVAILGFGREGKSTYNLIRSELPNIKITILDQNSNAIDGCNDNNLELISDNYLNKLDQFDLVIKTPGISLIGREYQTEITSQFDLLMRFTNLFTIGITGTKGKSTTSSLIYKIINDQNKNSFYVGNIGIPVFDYIKEFNNDSIIVAELSAHQLNDMHNSPNIGIILNLYEEHLDYFHTLDNYYNAKLNMFRYQSENDYAIYYESNKVLNEMVQKLNLKSHKLKINEVDINNNLKANNVVYDWDKGQKLVGKYNMIDVLFAIWISELLHLDFATTEQSIREFEPLDHRMKLVGIYNDIYFYDDTLATIPEATLNSIDALDSIETLIIGGLDRNIDYSGFTDNLKKSRLKNIICQPDTGIKFYEELKDSDKNVFYIEELEDAVIKAYEVTEPNKACLLSPAAPSYNRFKNYEEKSNKYKEFIIKYEK